jgi:hypothetical protein
MLNNQIYFLGDQTISAIFRIFVIILFVLIILNQPKNKRLFIQIVPIFLCSLWISAHSYGSALGGENDIVKETQFYFKILLPILLYEVILIQLSKGELNKNRIKKIVSINAIVIISNLLLGFFGIGFGNYGENEAGEMIGSKGYFYAGNEVSATLIAIFALFMAVYKEELRRNFIMFFTVIGIFFIASLMSLSKTSLIGFFLVFAFVIYQYFSLSKKIIIVLSFAIASIATQPWWYPILDLAIDRWEFFWEKTDFLDFITSGRSERVVFYFKWFNGADTFWQLFMGGGQRAIVEVGLFENDLLDLTISSGLLGLFFYGVWISWAWSGLKTRKKRHASEGPFVFYVMSIFILLSVIAGHVIYSATLAPFIALIALASVWNIATVPSAAHMRLDR